MNIQHLEEALVLCDDLLTELIKQDVGNKGLVMLSNIKSKIISGLDEPEIKLFKFKEGDHVVCIAENGYVEIGTQGIVTENDSTVPFVRWAEDKQGRDYVVWALIEEQMELVEDQQIIQKNKIMATKFMTLDNMSKQPAIKRTVFTHVLNIRGINNNEIYNSETEDTPGQWNNVLLIGSDETYGDVFKCWDDGGENNFTIYFGVKGDEFE